LPNGGLLWFTQRLTFIVKALENANILDGKPWYGYATMGYSLGEFLAAGMFTSYVTGSFCAYRSFSGRWDFQFRGCLRSRQEALTLQSGGEARQTRYYIGRDRHVVSCALLCSGNTFHFFFLSVLWFLSKRWGLA